MTGPFGLKSMTGAAAGLEGTPPQQGRGLSADGRVRRESGGGVPGLRRGPGASGGHLCSGFLSRRGG